MSQNKNALLAPDRVEQYAIAGLGGLAAHQYIKFRKERRLRKQEQRDAAHDKLTGLYNRPIFDEELKREVGSMRRDGHTTSVLFVDLDHFKKVNDTYKHAAGDEALRTVGGILRNSLRVSDIAGRYGGEELVVLLPGDDEEQAFLAAERLRQDIEATTIQSGVNQFNVTASIGVSVINPELEETDWLEGADTALYAAKAHGRNRVVRFSQVPPPELTS